MKCINKNDLTVNNLKGNIKSIKTTKNSFRVKYGNLLVLDDSYDTEKNIFVTFNNNGNVVEEITYDSSEKLIFKLIWKYNNKGIKIANKVYSFSGDLMSYSKFEQKNNGDLIEYVNDWNITYKYNKKGYVIEENWKDNTSKDIGISYSHKYDAMNNEIEWTFYDNFNFSKITYTYDSNHNLIEENCFCSNGIMFEKKTYKYVFDLNHNWIKKIEFVYEKGEKKKKNIYHREIKI